MDTKVASLSLDHVHDAPSAVPEEPGARCFMARNMRIDVRSRGSNRPRFAVEVRDLGSVRVARSHGTRSSFTRARHHLADGRDLVSVIISNRGRFLLEDDQGEGHFGAGGAAILESRHESALHKLDDTTGVWSICIERAPLEPLLAGMQAPLQRCLQGDVAELRLLRGYLEGLFAVEKNHDPALAATHIRELVLSAVGIRGDVRALLREGGTHAARKSAVLQAIGRRAAEPGLDPAEVARQSGISVRYLHHLLEPTGRTFSQHLLEQRLQRALAELRNPDQRGRIADIAFACGFSDISHFNRSFRRAFGDTPHGMRVRSTRARSAGGEPY